MYSIRVQYSTVYFFYSNSRQTSGETNSIHFECLGGKWVLATGGDIIIILGTQCCGKWHHVWGGSCLTLMLCVVLADRIQSGSMLLLFLELYEVLFMFKVVKSGTSAKPTPRNLNLGRRDRARGWWERRDNRWGSCVDVWEWGREGGCIEGKGVDEWPCRDPPAGGVVRKIKSCSLRGISLKRWHKSILCQVMTNKKVT